MALGLFQSENPEAPVEQVSMVSQDSMGQCGGLLAALQRAQQGPQNLIPPGSFT